MARILVIDDDTDLLEMVELLVERRGGHEAILSTNGEAGVQKARQTPPDLAIVDVMMPGMTGYDVCRRLREVPETKSIPILVLTARGQPVDREAAMQAGADAHLAKPVAMADLMEKIEGMLAEAEASKRSRTIVLASLKGGVGVTTMAVNVAASLIRSGHRSVCLLDLSPSSGHMTLHFGRRPSQDWSSLMEAEVIDATTVKQLLLRPTDGLCLLASPVVPLIGEALTRSTVEALLKVLQAEFDLVIVDTPSVLNEATVGAIEASSESWLVLAADAASIQTTFGTVQALGERAKRFPVILNQVSPARRASPEAIGRVLSRSLSAIVPFDPDQSQALAQGKPLVFSKPQSPLARAVEQLTDDLV